MAAPAQPNNKNYMRGWLKVKLKNDPRAVDRALDAHFNGRKEEATVKDIKDMTMKELVILYNQHAAKPVKRFSDRKTAERRVQELLKTVSPAKQKPEKSSPKPQSGGLGPGKRSGVEVDGVYYSSVLAAYKALGLPDGDHKKFRKMLKEAGSLPHFGHTWEVVPLRKKGAE